MDQYGQGQELNGDLIFSRHSRVLYVKKDELGNWREFARQNESKAAGEGKREDR